MQKIDSVIVGRMLFLSSLFSAQAFADIQILGSESEISQVIAQSYHQPVTPYNGTLSRQDLLYVNAGSASEDELSLAQKHIVHGEIVVLDLSAIADEEAQLALSQKLTGLGISAPIVVTGTYQGDTLVNAIVSDVRDEDGSVLNSPTAALDSITQSLQHALNRFGFGSIVAVAPPPKAKTMNTDIQKYVPIVEKPIYITSSNISCRLYNSAEFDKVSDWCSAGASIDVRVNVALMRSIQSATAAGFTPDAKIVRFTVDADKPGTGIHLVNELKQEHSWFQSWANRRTYIGPFAHRYDLWVKPVAGYTPKKAGDSPINQNRDYKHSETRGFVVGINGKANAIVGPKLSGEIGGSFTYNYSKTLQFDTKEYRINNSSSLSDFSISFERELTECDELHRQELGCYFTAPHWGNSWVFDKRKFNPISYANFKPNYDVLYETPVSEHGTTDFEVGMTVNYAARFGKVIPTIFYSFYGPESYSRNSTTVTQKVRVDWNHPLFEGEAHVTLQSLSNNDLCLDSYNGKENGSKVSGWSCHGEWNQVWGLDKEQRYRSRAAADRCLTVGDNLLLTVEQCGMSLAQKWYWEGDKLISRYVSGSNSRYVLDIIGSNTVGVSPEESATHARWLPMLQQIKL